MDTPRDPGSAIRTTNRSSDHAGRLGDGDALERAISRSRRRWADAGMIGDDGSDTFQDPERPATHRAPQTRLEALLAAVGGRYRHCTLDTFRCNSPEQRHAVEQLRGYIDRWEDHRRHGRGIVAIGGVGGGKDHLLIGAAREIIAEHGETVRWLSGPRLFSEARVHMGKDEAAWVGDYLYCRVLILSDPLPPRGGLTDHQAATVQLIIDERYRNRRPTWTTLNVQNSSEADERMGASIVDRLTADATIIKCDWPSYRRPLNEG